MNNIELKLDTEPKEKYEKAKKDLLQALKSYGELTLTERECLMTEFFGATNIAIVCNMLNKYFK